MTRTLVTRIGIVTYLVLALLPYSAHAACQLKQLASVDIEVMPNGAVQVPVQINGNDAWLALNLSSGMPMIGPSALQPMGLKAIAQADKNMFFNGQKVTQQVKVDSLRMGNANFTDWIMYVVPGQGRPLNHYKERPMAGLLASVFMNVVDVELDLAGRKMNLFEHASCKGEQVYWGGEASSARLYTDASGLMYFPLELDGKQVETSLNTTGPRTVISERVTRDYFGFGIGSEGVSVQTANSQNGPVQFGVRPMGLSAKGLEIDGVPVVIESTRGGPRCTPSTSRESGAIGFNGCSSIVPMELGTQVLSRLRIYIASKEKRIYFTRVGSAAPN